MSSEGRLFDGYDTEDLAQESIQFLRDNEPEDGYYVAFSGGKDSQVVLDLVQRAGVKYEAHYHLTTCDPPENVHYIRQEYPFVIIDKPQKDRNGKAKTMWWLIAVNGRPTRKRRWCCKHLKETGGNGRSVVTGVRVSESSARANQYGNKIGWWEKRKAIQVMPILYWSDADIWAYIEQRGLVYNPLYDEPGIDRIGCVLCPKASDTQRQWQAKRWPKIAAAWRRALNQYVERRNRGKKPLPPYVTGEYLYRAHLGLPIEKREENEGELFKGQA